MSRTHTRRLLAFERFPCVSGDEPLEGLPEEREGTFSPRERG